LQDLYEQFEEKALNVAKNATFNMWIIYEVWPHGLGRLRRLNYKSIAVATYQSAQTLFPSDPQ
jgi:hypothetical protein